MEQTAGLSGSIYAPPEDDRYRRSNNVQKGTIICTIFLFALLIILIGLCSAIYGKVKEWKQVTSVTTVYTSLGMPGYESLSWNDIEERAGGGQVNFWSWDGDSQINEWIDGWLAVKVANIYGIKVNRIGISATSNAIEKIASERAHGFHTNGSVDLVWINGENYREARVANNLYGPWAKKVPSAINFNFYSKAIMYDFGYSTDGFEMPYNAAQVAFIYNNLTVPNPPASIVEMVAWIKENPGKYIYAAPWGSDGDTYDFTGSVFVRQVFYEYSGPYTDFNGDFNQALFNKRSYKTWKVLREIEPFLYNGTKYGQPFYPKSQKYVDDLFANGTIWMTLSYDPFHAASMILNNEWPVTTRSYVLATGTIANTNYIAIGYNAKNVLPALVVGNYIASMAAQFSRRQPERWGAQQCYDTESKNFINGGWQVAFDYIPRNVWTPSVASLRAGELSELNAVYTSEIQYSWRQCVVNYAAYASTAVCKGG